MKKIIFLLFLLASIAHADMYYWVDDNGVKHFSNAPVPSESTQLEQREEIKHDIQQDTHKASENAFQKQAEADKEAKEQAVKQTKEQQKQKEQTWLNAYNSIKKGDDRLKVVKTLGQPISKDTIHVNDWGAFDERWTYFFNNKIITIDFHTWAHKTQVTKKQISQP
jgi:thiamine pyrophosphate-dependent acetolactate synthase large subunit-like protein